MGKILIRKYVDGEIHYSLGVYALSLLSAIAICIGIFVLGLNWWDVVSKVGLVFSAGVFATAFVSPDLDLIHSYPKRRWGRLSWIFEPYRLMVGGHRSFWSHGIEPPRKYRNHKYLVLLFKMFGFLIGTIGRVLYLSIWALLVCLCIDWVVGSWIFTQGVLMFVISEITPYLFIGFVIADAIHVNYDRL